ncbi:respiratory chain complex I subunit 1 family protein [Nitrospina gracilis]|uniref:respiratory chain complex I subunit 1 family protein n=1 Tax=Nitrospina gracilis TaxID=35801 RepID=UPI001F02F329|nr:NADH-quinone oxidoreductase subunit H [Nitrospina gracilis]MCF8721276.1 formate hydrogenlyase subunit 4 [Nitrospina gracilis Nb-211]
MKLWVFNFLQALFLIGLSPLAAAILKKMKAYLQNRRGPGLLQTYRDLAKWFNKEPIMPHGASWIFRLAPYIIFASTALACAIVPVILTQTPLSAAADVITLVALFALARFFTALGAMDVGTAFGGMGASREMTFAALAEPAMLMGVFVASMAAESTNLSSMIDAMLNGNLGLRPSLAFALTALLLVAIAETGRIPVDNPATHLELTMVHEAMILEYSGRYLALIEWASQMKLILFATILLNLFVPWGIAQEPATGALLAGLAAWLLKLLVLLAGLALLETLLAKMRIFRLPEYLGLAFLLAILGMLTHYILEGPA